MKRTPVTTFFVVVGLLLIVALASCGHSTIHHTIEVERVHRPRGRRVATVFACLHQNGVGLSRESYEGNFDMLTRFLVKGGLSTPLGMPRSHFDTILKKCGVGSLQVAGNPITQPGLRLKIARFADCLRANGVSVSGPDFSGRAPALTIREAEPPRLIAAERICEWKLRQVLRRGVL